MTRLSFIALLFFYSGSIFANETCSEINVNARSAQSYIDSDKSGYIVSGHGRLYFYNAPDESCINKEQFLITGDLVNVYTEFNGFSSVMYFKKNGETVEGWLKSESLKSTGTGVGPKL